MNYFVRQFGKPESGFGRFLSRIMNYSNKKMYKSNISYIISGISVLEIGFGNGKQLEMINNIYPDIHLYGVELSEDMLDMAKERLGDNAELSHGTAENLSFEDTVFDVVITTDTCYFWKNPKRVMHEIMRVLKVNGIFVNAYNSMYADFVRRSRREDGLYDDISIIKMAGETGFDILESNRIGICKRQIVMKKRIL